MGKSKPKKHKEQNLLQIGFPKWTVDLDEGNGSAPITLGHRTHFAVDFGESYEWSCLTAAEATLLSDALAEAVKIVSPAAVDDADDGPGF